MSIGFGVTVGPGVRVRESIILGNTVLQNHSCILHSIVGWNSVIGSWVRIEGTPSDPDPNKAYAKIEHQNLFSRGKLNPSITIIGLLFLVVCSIFNFNNDLMQSFFFSFKGSNVTIPSELLVKDSIILPHKELNQSYKNEIIL